MDESGKRQMKIDQAMMAIAQRRTGAGQASPRAASRLSHSVTITYRKEGNDNG